MTKTMTLDWKPTTSEEIQQTSVKLTDAPDITWRRKEKFGPGVGRPYSIRFKFVRYDGGPWTSNITIYAQRPEGIIGDFFSSRQVVDMPQWLADLIDSATPRES